MISALTKTFVNLSTSNVHFKNNSKFILITIHTLMMFKHDGKIKAFQMANNLHHMKHALSFLFSFYFKFIIISGMDKLVLELLFQL